MHILSLIFNIRSSIFSVRPSFRPSECGHPVEPSGQYTISPGEINEEISISLTYVINLSLFWFHLTKNLPFLSVLMEDINYCYDSFEDLGSCMLPIDSKYSSMDFPAKLKKTHFWAILG